MVLVLAGMAVAWAMGSCSEGSCTVGACSRVQEARRVVAEADSLRAAGVTYCDSAAMAQTVSSLEWVRAFYPTDYAHANYYLGRILRNSGDHPAAMEAFLRVTHSRTSDHTIKGRAYSNIGNMCRLASEHEIACDIYLKAADEFRKAKDTISYYYSLNNVAVDLAENKQSEDALFLLDRIGKECTDYNVRIKTWETAAIIYNRSQQYESTITCINKLQQTGYCESTGMLCKAQAFEHLGQNDSALFYANRVMEITTDWNDRYNALYILSHNNPLLRNEEILALTSDRADLGKLQETRQGFLSQAVQLLQQDLNREPNLGWLVGTLFTLILVGISLRLYFVRKKKEHKLFSQQVDALLRRKDTLSEQTQQMEQRQAEHEEKVIREIEIFCATIDIHNVKDELCWKDFDKMCTIVNRRMFGLADKLKAKGLSKEKDIQLCVLVVINKFRDRQMADLLNYADTSIRGIKRSVAISLGTTSKNMRSFLLKDVVLG